MTQPISPPRWSVARVAGLVLGALFVYLGVIKALDPVGFLKLVRQFQVIDRPPALNLIAAVLPWFEVFCGFLLLLNIKPRATALIQAVMLVGFTLLVLLRAMALYRAGSTPFCGIRFDCGCGTGEVLICLKLLENSAMIALAGFVAWRGAAHPEPQRREDSKP